ncbi:hypothetical protein TNCV_881481 [Trichonephila clavipes]|nr:hypothetical protein TNCV_881481 [Trichonephila clavipes]
MSLGCDDSVEKVSDEYFTVSNLLKLVLRFPKPKDPRVLVFNYNARNSTHPPLGVNCDLGSLVDKVKDSWLACLEFEPSTAKDLSCRDRGMLNLSRLKRLLVGVAWKLEEGNASSGFVNAT